MSLIGAGELEALEDAVERAFATGNHDHLEVLGYGEISSVVAWPTAGGKVATKRLPPLADRAAFEAYAGTVADYLDALERAGVHPVATEIHAVDKPDGRVIAYCVQPILAADSLGPRRFRDGVGVEAGFDTILAAVTGAVGPRLGLDAQLSNWSFTGDGGAVYVDITTPMLRDEAGREQLDGDFFLASLPWVMRGPVKRLLLGSILATYYDPRKVMVDVLANLIKERLDGLLPALIERTAGAFDQPISEREVRRYYRSDARTWAALQRLRRADRAWQRKVRRRPYEFLLPGRIDR